MPVLTVMALSRGWLAWMPAQGSPQPFGSASGPIPAWTLVLVFIRGSPGLVVFEPRAGSDLDVGFGLHRRTSFRLVVVCEVSPGLPAVSPRVEPGMDGGFGLHGIVSFG